MATISLFPKRRRARTLSGAVFGVLPLVGAQDAVAAAPCRLGSVQLRFGNRPVDLVPAFSPGTFAYFATLDFSMDSVTFDATPADGCVADGVPTKAIPLEAGKDTQVAIYAKSPATTERQAYQVQVGRLNGFETTLQDLAVQGATLGPAFAREVREYVVFLPLEYDFITLRHLVRDTGQGVSVTVGGEVDAGSLPLPDFDDEGGQAPTPNVDSGHASDVDAVEVSPARRLTWADVLDDQMQSPRTGPRQYVPKYQSFLVGVGRARRVTITLQAANPMQAYISHYIVDITRGNCSVSRPLYDPLSHKCVVSCPAHFYANWASSRCSGCNTNCAVCGSLTRCELCRRDDAHNAFAVEPDGSCRRIPHSIETRYWWWCIGVGSLVVLLGCYCVVLFCQALCRCCCPPRKNYGIDDSDSEGDYEVQRRQGTGPYL